MQDINNKLAEIVELLKDISKTVLSMMVTQNAINAKLDTVNNKLDDLIRK
jgi:hypothetical protein